MCVAIAKPAGKVIDKETLQQCFTQNPDGCGFAYINSAGELRIHKSMEFDAFYAEFEPVQLEHPDSPMLIHFRIKTHGTKDLFNCHPFKVDENIAFIHNGVISKIDDCPDKIRSDTQMFNELVLQKLPDGWTGNEAIKLMIEEYIGFSKLAVLDKRSREITLFNETKGSWKGGIWYSNLLWEPRKSHYDSGYYKTYTHTDRCLQCDNWIRNNVYANVNNVNFCSANCKDIYKSKWMNSYKKHPCDYCGKDNTHITLYRDKVEFHYCSQYCKEKHLEADANSFECLHCGNDLTGHVLGNFCNAFCRSQYETKQIEHKPTLLTVECKWCNEWCAEVEMVEVVEEHYTHTICIDCLEYAVANDVVVETEEIKSTIESVRAKIDKQAC